LITAQRADAKLSECFVMANNNKHKLGFENKSVCAYYYVSDDGILMRKLRTKGNNICDEIVVPEVYKGIILDMAHDAKFSGHMGTKRTFVRLAQRFYWAKCRYDVKNWVKSCAECQIAGKRGDKIKAPLINVPVMPEVFHKVAIDLTGPFRTTEMGNRYILVLQDYGSRWVEALPLPDIEATTVADGLIQIFSRLGFPREVLSDRGGQFISTVMEQLFQKCEIKHILCSPYHPQGNGMIEI
jgi:hypothetical protein